MYLGGVVKGYAEDHIVWILERDLGEWAEIRYFGYLYKGAFRRYKQSCSVLMVYVYYHAAYRHGLYNNLDVHI